MFAGAIQIDSNGNAYAVKMSQQKKQKQLSVHEQAFAIAWNDEYPNIDLIAHYRFMAPLRQFEFDFTHIDSMVAIEIEGGNYRPPAGKKTGGHRSITGFNRDLEKYFIAATRGWFVLRLSSNMITIKNIKAIYSIIEQRLDQLNSN